jgi:hypothetical protein
MYRAKEITATSIAIYGTQAALASTYQHIVGYGSELIGELTDFSGPSGGARIIDATPIDSTVQRIKTVMRNPGQISLSMNYEGFSYGQKEIRTDPESCKRRSYAIEFTDKGAGGGSTLLHSWVNFNGYCVNYSISAAVDSKISANAVIEIDGPMNWSSQ